MLFLFFYLICKEIRLVHILDTVYDNLDYLHISSFKKSISDGLKAT